MPMSYLNKCLRMMVDSHASDLYLVSGEAPVARIYGSLQRMTGESVLSNDFVVEIAKSLFSVEQLATLELDKSLDFAIELGTVEEGGP